MISKRRGRQVTKKGQTTISLKYCFFRAEGEDKVDTKRKMLHYLGGPR